jgi:deoxycytidine triphosphate deaminase
MILNRDKILARSAADAAFITPFESRSLKNSSYSLRAGTFFLPKSGEKIEDEVTLKPNQVAIVVTMEQVSMPADLCAIYTLPQALSSTGLMLINISTIEPGYKGYLTCFILNFSAESRTLRKNDAVAKMTFMLTDDSANCTKDVIAPDAYLAKRASEAKRRFTETFLNTKAVADAAASEVNKMTIITGSVFLGLLAVLNLAEPFYKQYMESSNGALEVSKLIEIQKGFQDSYSEREKVFEGQIEQLTKDIKDLQGEISRNAAPTPAPSPAQNPPTPAGPKP